MPPINRIIFYTIKKVSYSFLEKLTFLLPKNKSYSILKVLPTLPLINSSTAIGFSGL